MRFLKIVQPILAVLAFLSIMGGLIFFFFFVF